MKILKGNINKKETNDFLNHLQSFNTISKPTKKEIISTIGDSITYADIGNIISSLSDKSKVELIKIVPKLKKQQIENIDFQNTEIQKEISNTLYKKYIMFFQKRKHNNISLSDALKYSTTWNHVKHRTKIGGTYGEGNYFLETDEPWVNMRKNTEKNYSQDTITKYFGPIFIRTKRVTANTIDDIKLIIKNNQKYKTDDILQLQEGDFILEFDIGPSDLKSLKEGFESFKQYLEKDIYNDILERNNFDIQNKDDINLKFIYGITAINILAKRQGWHILNIPKQTAKKTATFMYGMMNPYAEILEQPGILKFLSNFNKNAKEDYERLKLMSKKFDVRDIKFCYTTPENILKR